MAAIAAYLPQTSWVLFATALGGSGVIEQPWEGLDFSDLEKSLAAKLTDDDISNVLKCIDAKNHLKRLNLAGCLNVVGGGLESLRDSLLLEQFDIGMVAKYEKPTISPAPNLSEAAVLPILESIISNANGSLKLPHEWCDANSSALQQFLGDHEQFQRSCHSTWSFCNSAFAKSSAHRVALVVANIVFFIFALFAMISRDAMIALITNAVMKKAAMYLFMMSACSVGTVSQQV